MKSHQLWSRHFIWLHCWRCGLDQVRAHNTRRPSEVITGFSFKLRDGMRNTEWHFNLIGFLFCKNTFHKCGSWAEKMNCYRNKVVLYMATRAPPQDCPPSLFTVDVASARRREYSIVQYFSMAFVSYLRSSSCCNSLVLQIVFWKSWLLRLPVVVFLFSHLPVISRTWTTFDVFTPLWITNFNLVFFV